MYHINITLYYIALYSNQIDVQVDVANWLVVAAPAVPGRRYYSLVEALIVVQTLMSIIVACSQLTRIGRLTRYHHVRQIRGLENRKRKAAIDMGYPNYREQDNEKTKSI